MSETISSIGEAASNAANDVLLNKTESLICWLKGLITWEHLFKFIGTIFILFVMWVIFRLIAKAIRRVPETKLPAQRTAIIIRFLK